MWQQSKTSEVMPGKVRAVGIRTSANYAQNE